MEPNFLNLHSQYLRLDRRGRLAVLRGLALTSVVASLFLAGCGALGVTLPHGSSSTCGSSTQTVSHVAPGEAGLYAAAVDGIYRFQAQQGHLTLIWHTPYQVLRGAISTSVVLTPVAVADDEAFVAIQAASGEDISIDALSTIDGHRRWRTTISGSEISNLFASQHSVYLETDALGGIVIRALYDQTGSQRWSQTFPFGDANNGYFPGLGDIANGVVYAANDNALLALDASTGRLLWQRPFGATETFLPPVLMDGVLYDNAYEAANGPSAVYAINPANGRELWQTRVFGATADSLNETIATEANGLVYFGSVDGFIYAVNARDGAPVWNTSMKYAVNAAPVVLNSAVYVGGAPGNGVNPNTYRGEVLALDAATGEQLWSYVLPSVGYDGVYPLIVAGGVVFVETGTGDIYTVNSTTGYQITQIRVGGDCGTSTDPALTLVA